MSGIVLWYLGYPDRARTRIHEGLDVAQQLAHPHYQVWGLHVGAVFYQLSRRAGCRGIGRGDRRPGERAADSARVDGRAFVAAMGAGARKRAAGGHRRHAPGDHGLSSARQL